VPQATVWYRAHREALGPILFGPRNPLGNRYDDPACVFGTLYAGEMLEVAFVESMLRNPNLHLVSLAEIAARRWTAIQASRDLRLVDFCGPGLSAVGTTGGVNTGSYRVSQAWAAALHGHPDAPDGILYLSRHNPPLRCVAVFDRPGLTITAGHSVDFETPWLASPLTSYGKMLTP
jgi:RES domain.